MRQDINGSQKTLSSKLEILIACEKLGKKNSENGMKMMAVNINFENSNKAELEAAISKGSIEAMRLYGEQAFAEFKGNIEELAHRKNVLFRAPHNGHTHIIRHVVMLAALTNDVSMCKFLIKELEQAGDPAMGYYVYLAISKGEGEQRNDPIWLSFLNSSANAGFIPARLKVSQLKYGNTGFYGRTMMFFIRSVLLFKAIAISLKKTRDMRLP